MSLGFLSLFIQILMFGFAILFHVEKNKYFWIKFACSAVIGGGICILVEYFIQSPFLFIIPFAFNVILYRICYKTNIYQSAFFGIIGYSLQSLTFNISFLIDKIIPDFTGMWFHWCLYVILAVTCYFLLARKMRLTLIFSVKNVGVDIVCVFILVLVYILNMYWIPTSNIRADVLFRILMIVCVLTSLWIVFGIAVRVQLDREKHAIEELLRREENLHRLSKDAIDTINRKCHDLKHTVAAIRAGGAMPEEELAEIENAVQVYDGFVRTGNKDLDIVMAEKCLRCKENEILLSCIIDGAKLNFMTPGDSYSLFGNILDNAIECLEKVEEVENRIVSLNVQAHNRFVTIRAENYCAEPLVFEDGLPKSSKQDKNNHGWGLKSVKYIVEKYEGTFVLIQKDDMFTISIAIPMR